MMDQASMIDAVEQTSKVIYCYGGIDIYRDTFNAIAMLNNDKSFIKTLFAIASVFGGLWAIVVLAFGDMLKPFTNWIIPATIMQTFLMMPGNTVWLVDVVQHKHYKVDNVPFGLSVLASNISRISYKMTKKVETIFSMPDDLKYHRSGGVFGANLMENMKIFTIQDANFSENMRGFVGNCVLYDVALGRKYTIDDLRKTNDIWGLVSANASPARSFIWRDRGAAGEIITCREGVTKFNAAFNSQINQAACNVGSLLFGNATHTGQYGQASNVNAGTSSLSTGDPYTCKNPLAKQEMMKYLPLHYHAFTGASRSAMQIIQQQMMIAAVVDGQDHASVMAGNTPNFAVRKAYLQQRATNETFGKLAANTLPILRATLELLCYAMFIFLIPILVLPMGYRVLTSWAQVVVWLSMWPPMYAILNMIMTSAQSMRTVACASNFNSDGLSMISSLGVQQISADISSQAGYLSTLVPFVCIAIVKGLSNFMHLSSSLMGSGQGAASAAAAEATSGNFSYANSSLENMSYKSTNMLSQNYSPHLSSGDFRIQDGHTSLSVGSDGHAVMHVEQSQLPVSVNFSEQISQNKRQAASEQQSLGESYQKSAERTESSNIENFAQLGKTLSENENTQMGSTSQKQIETGKSMQQVDQAITNLSDALGTTKQRAATIMASANAGVALPLQNLTGVSAGASLNGSLESSSATREEINKARTIIQQTNLEENLRIAEHGLLELGEHSTNEKTKSLIQNHQASVGQAIRESELAQKHFDKSKQYTKEADYAESHSRAINANYNDKFFDWLAHQDAKGMHNQPMGVRAAKNILSDVNLAQAYAKEYIRQNQENIDLGPKPSMEEFNQPLETDIKVDKKSVENLAKEGEAQISQDLFNKTAEQREKIELSYNKNDEKMNAEKNDISQERNKLDKKNTDYDKEVGIISATETGAKAVGKGAVKTYQFVKEDVLPLIANKDVALSFMPFASNLLDIQQKDLQKHPEARGTLLQDKKDTFSQDKMESNETIEYLDLQPQRNELMGKNNQQAEIQNNTHNSFSQESITTNLPIINDVKERSVSHQQDAIPFSLSKDKQMDATKQQSYQQQVNDLLQDKKEPHSPIKHTDRTLQIDETVAGNSQQTPIQNNTHNSFSQESITTNLPLVNDVKERSVSHQQDVTPFSLSKDNHEAEPQEREINSQHTKIQFDEQDQVPQAIETEPFTTSNARKMTPIRTQQTQIADLNTTTELTPQQLKKK